MFEVLIASGIGVVGALAGAYFGARWNAHHVEQLEEGRRADEAERRAKELKAAARIVMLELGIAAIAVANSRQEGHLLPFRGVPTSAWSTHGVCIAGELPASVHDSVAKACAKAASAAALVAAMPVELVAQMPVNRVPQLPELEGLCRTAQDLLRPHAYPAQGA